MSRPRIGICAALEPAAWGLWHHTAALISSVYFEAVQRGDGLALLLPPDEHLIEEPDEILRQLDGLMLAGGADIDPATYGAERHPQTGESYPERDAFEIALARAAVARDMPVLGICRGMQLLNVALGGTLLQHLPERFGHDNHLRRPGTFEDSDHDVELVEGSLAATVAGETLHVTKSHHHQGVAEIGQGLLVSGTSLLDGLPEAIELPTASFVLGVQWHPEVDLCSPVVTAFVEAARRSRDERGQRELSEARAGD